MSFPFPIFCPRIAPPLDGLSGVRGAWSMARYLLTSYGAGSLYTDAGGGAVSSLADQSGNGYNATQGTGANRPTAATAGPQSRACADFDGTNDVLTGTTVSNLIANNAGYIIAVVYIDAIDTNVTTANNGYQNDALFSDNAANLGIHFRSGGGTPNVLAQSFDGNSDDTPSVNMSTGAVHVVEWRHDSGTLYVRVDGGTEQSTASGNATVSGTFQVGARYDLGAYMDGKLFEMVAFNAVPTLSQRDALVANMLAYYA